MIPVGPKDGVGNMGLSLQYQQESDFVCSDGSFGAVLSTDMRWY